MLQNLNFYYRITTVCPHHPSSATWLEYTPILFEVHFNIILPSVPRSCKWSVLQVSPPKPCMNFCSSPHVTSPTIWWYLITPKWHFVRSSNHEWCSLRNFLQYPVISSTSGPDTFLTTCNTLSPHHSLWETIQMKLYVTVCITATINSPFPQSISCILPHTAVTTLTRLQASRPRNCCSIPGTARYVCLHDMQTDPGAHPACNSVGTTAKAAGVWSSSQSTT